jgi:hypothetical protein
MENIKYNKTDYENFDLSFSKSKNIQMKRINNPFYHVFLNSISIIFMMLSIIPKNIDLSRRQNLSLFLLQIAFVSNFSPL